MTDYTTADEIAAVWADVTPELAGATHTDTYDIVRDVRTSDGRGGYTTAPGVVESGRCALIAGRTQGREGLSGDVVQSTYRLEAEMPVDTIAQASDVIDINGDRYQIVAVTTPGFFGPQFRYAQLEAVS